MFDFLWSNVSNSTSTPTRAASVRPTAASHLGPSRNLPAVQRCAGISCGSSAITNTKHYHPAEHIPPHIHVHNVSHAHSLIFLGNPNRTIWHNYSYPHPHGGHPPSNHHGYPGIPDGFGGSLSSWYQLNLGLIGIGALAVVAIIGSRNFFSNYVYYKKSKKYDSEYYDYEPYEYDGYYRRNWYEEWYDRWYRDHGYSEDEYDDNGYDDHRFGGDQNDHYSYKNRYKRGLNSRNKPASAYVDTGQPSKRRTQNRKKSNAFAADKQSKIDARKSATNCAFRLTCELTRERKRMLSELEWNLLRRTRFKGIGVDIFKVLDDGLPSKPAAEDYKIAQKLGTDGFDCEKLSGFCPLSRWQIKRMKAQFDRRAKLNGKIGKIVRSHSAAGK